MAEPRKVMLHGKRRGTSLLRTSNSGFTLLELLIVVVIIGVMTTFGAITMRGMAKESDTNATVGSVESIFDQARTSAVEKGRPVYVRGTDDATKFASILNENKDAGKFTTNWDVGIYFFVDANQDADYDTSKKDELLGVYKASDVKIFSNGGADSQIIFLPNGMSGYADERNHRAIDANKGDVTITICGHNGNKYFIRKMKFTTTGSMTREDTNKTAASFDAAGCK